MIQKHELKKENKKQLKAIKLERDKKIAEINNKQSLEQYVRVMQKIENAINEGKHNVFVFEHLYDNNYRKLRKEGFKINYCSLDNETIIHW